MNKRLPFIVALCTVLAPLPAAAAYRHGQTMLAHPSRRTLVRDTEGVMYVPPIMPKPQGIVCTVDPPAMCAATAVCDVSRGLGVWRCPKK